MNQLDRDRCGAATLYCPQCGDTMRVATEHLHTMVACPHCGHLLDPGRAARVGAPPPPPPMIGFAAPTIAGVSSRSRIVAALLGIFLGSLGAHRFYLGYITIGIVQIVLTFVTFGLAGLWGFVEGILCLTGHVRDVDGLPLRD